MSAQRERRFFEAEELELRADEGASRRVSGYFAVYDQFSPVYGRFREKIAPGFFDEALAKDDVRALFNHDESKLLGRNRAGTLRLRSDDKGLYGEIDPIPATPTGEEVLENLRLGNLTGASFAFTLPPEGGDAWRKADDGVWERTLVRAGGLHDVSVVTNPWYPQTDVGARMEMRSDLEASFARWAESHPEEVSPPDFDLVKMRMRLAEIT